MPHQIEVFTSMRLLKVIVSMAESAGSFGPAATTFPSAILIRATGRFFDAASFRDTASTICPTWNCLYFAHPLACLSTLPLSGAARLVQPDRP
ncbi:hypothetical protein [Streptomyces sp. NBC_00059]|uniref:hypothetical protein n=1 Tax=Streptomyces sp. NBC_00059 TaxID=2975635 RepID=UPI0022538690|nr:hypothetical protein [Streptomyces sp. NBC_00059]MCX5415555.1 hypothetical protein [Streptomyces sp. NBC_00059]